MPRVPNEQASPPPDQRVKVTGGDLAVTEESGFYDAYADFARNVRTWFLAYGIGAPVLLFSTEEAWRAIKSSETGIWVAYLFLAGVAIQILAALVYKTAMWFLYVGERKSSFKSTRRYRTADFFSENYTIEILLDIVTLALFGVATFVALKAIIT